MNNEEKWQTGKMKKEDELSRKIIDAAIEVHKTLGGPGLLESVYEEALVYELKNRGIKVNRQMDVPLEYKGKKLSEDLRLDLLVEQKVVVECKAISEFKSVFEAQTLTYLRLMDLKLGLVINFGRPALKDGIHRVVHNL